MKKAVLCLSILLASSLFSPLGAPAGNGSVPVSVEVSLDKDLGYFVGDLVKVSYRVSLPADRYLREDSLPGNGQSVGEWAEVREKRTRETESRDTRTYDVELTYQIFAAAETARTYEIPGIEFSYGPREAPSESSAAWPAAAVQVSPLASSEDVFKPPIFWSWSSPSPRIIRFAGAVLLVGSLGVAAFLFRIRSRRHSPFGSGLKRLSRLRDPRAALTLFRKALNEKAGKAIFPNNLEDLYAVFPQAKAHRQDLLDLVLISDEVSFNPSSVAVGEGLLRRVAETMKRLKRLETWA